MIVLSFKFDQNLFSSYRDVGVKIWVIALRWPMAYTALYYYTGVMTIYKLLSRSFIIVYGI